MKKTTLYFVLTAMMACYASCSREEKNLFDDSAAERLQKTIATTKGYLCVDNASWEMLYFPTPESAGYALLCQFNKNGSVTVGAKNRVSSNNQFKTETSLWDIDGTQGVVLSFNSYNNLLSIFADPQDDGVGYAGDYEFVVLSANGDQLQLKGKKSGSYIEMNKKMNLDWEEYYRQIDYFNELVFLGNDGIKMNYTNGDTLMEMTYNKGQFTFNHNDADTTLGIIITPAKMRFYSSAPGANGMRDFIINEDLSKLVCVNDKEVFFSASYTIAEFFTYKFTKKARWVYTEEDTDAATAAAVQALKDEAAQNGATITRIAYNRLKGTSGQRVTYTYTLFVSYTVDNKVFEGHLNLNYSVQDNKITFSYKSADSNISKLLERLGGDEAGAQKFADIFCDTFTPSSYSGSTLNMVQMYLNGNNGKKIHVVADSELL